MLKPLGQAARVLAGIAAHGSRSPDPRFLFVFAFGEYSPPPPPGESADSVRRHPEEVEDGEGGQQAAGEASLEIFDLEKGGNNSLSNQITYRRFPHPDPCPAELPVGLLPVFDPLHGGVHHGDEQVEEDDDGQQLEGGEDGGHGVALGQGAVGGGARGRVRVELARLQDGPEERGHQVHVSVEEVGVVILVVASAVVAVAASGSDGGDVVLAAARNLRSCGKSFFALYGIYTVVLKKG